MKIQSLKNYELNSKENKLYKFNQHNMQLSCCKPQTGVHSIYSKGMTNIAFGNTVSKFSSYLEKEIAEQPNVIKKLYRTYFKYPDFINMDIGLTQKDVWNLKRINIIGSGSSKNAAEMAAPYISFVSDTPVYVKSASEFLNGLNPYDATEDLAIFISQSGKTADTFEAIRELANAKVKTIAITNDPASKIAQLASSHLHMAAGKEHAVAATKTVTSSIFNLYALGLKLSETKFNKYMNTPLLSIKRADIPIAAYIRTLKTIPDVIKEMLTNTTDVKEAAKILSDAKNIYVYAKGAEIGTAKEGALKLTETTGKRIIADSSGEALHGTFASIQPEDPVIHIITKNSYESYPNLINNMEEIVRKRNVKNPIIITNGIDRQAFNKIPNSPIFIDIPVSDSISNSNVLPLLETVRFQQLTNEVAKILKINPDNGGGFLTKFRQNMSM